MRRLPNFLGRRMIRQLRESWAEFDYAQRRLLEIQLGRPFNSHARPKIARSVEELEALFAYAGPRLPPEAHPGGRAGY
jgi:hypothetical protein